MSITQTESPAKTLEESAAAIAAAPAGESPFLNLPYEIRLQIYGWVHAAHPIQHAQLAPWYPTPTYSSYFLERIHPRTDAEDFAVLGSKPGNDSNGNSDDDACRKKARDDRNPLLSPHRHLGGMPSALLRANRQIYHECRLIPFHDNEFVFVNWFSSGLWAARAFTRGLRPWQRAEVRFARLEMLGRDCNGPALKELVELCEAWAPGLRGLRLKMLIGGGIFEPTASFAALKNNTEAQAMDICGPRVLRAWIDDGFKKLGELRELEVELSVMDWGDEEKIEWCRVLEGMLNEGRGEAERKVVVSAVKRSKGEVVVGGVVREKR